MLNRLTTRIQRLLFAVGVLGLVPWLALRVIAGTWRIGGVERYLQYAFLEPLSPWFEQGWWWYTELEWYDWPILPSIVFIFLAFIWPYGPAKLVVWVRGSHY